MRIKKRRLNSLLIALTLLTGACTHTGIKKPKNIVMVIVDGMGPEQVHVGRIFNGNEKLSFEKFTHKNTVTTHNIDGEVTDSAAAATAMATGQKVKNRVISPGKTLLEHFKEQGKSTGVITTTLLTDATPAAFASHAKSRRDTEDILKIYLENTQPNFIAGADEPYYIDMVKESNIDYTIVNSSSRLKALEKRIKNGEQISHVYAGFGQHSLVPGHINRKTAMPLEVSGDKFFKDNDIPHLSQVAQVALETLNQNEKGFFLMVESGLVDWVGHKNSEFKGGNNKPCAVTALGHEMTETNKTIEAIAKWAKAHPDTLVIVTADHETGGLKVDEKRTSCLGKKGCVANSSWTSGFHPEYEEKFSMHTGVDVGVYAMGPGSKAFSEPMDNTEFITKILGE